MLRHLPKLGKKAKGQQDFCHGQDQPYQQNSLALGLLISLSAL
jgi:hypothetical protein